MVTGSLEATHVDRSGHAGSIFRLTRPHSGGSQPCLRHGSAASSSGLAIRVDVSKAVQDSQRDLLNIGANRSVTAV